LANYIHWPKTFYAVPTLFLLLKIQNFYELHYCILLFQDVTHRWCYCYTHLRSLCSHHTENAIYGVSDIHSFTQHDFPNDFNEGWSLHVKVMSRSNTCICTCAYTHTHTHTHTHTVCITIQTSFSLRSQQQWRLHLPCEFPS